MEILSYVATAVTVVGTVANCLQKRWCFILWMITDIFWIVYNISIESYAQAALFVFNTVTCVIGLVKWGKKAKELKKISEPAINNNAE